MTSLRSGVKLKEMIKCIKHRLINIFSFSEDAGRLDYTFTFFGLTIFAFFPVLFEVYVLEAMNTNLVIGLYIIYVIAILANVSRRVNHLDNHSATVLLIFVPIVNLFFKLYLHFTPGKEIKK